jgi:predicted nucleotidyltransferase
MLPDRDHVMREIRQRLESAYGPRLRGIVLYGSEARGDAGPDSDIDLLVLLEGPVVWRDEIRKIIERLYSIQMETGRCLHAVPVDESDYRRAHLPLYQEASHEGILF